MIRKCPKCGYPNPDTLDRCFQCGAELVAKPPPAPPIRVRTNPQRQPAFQTELSPLTTFAAVLILIGVGAIFYYAFLFDVTVPVEVSEFIPTGRVNNIGLMNERLIGIICGFGSTFIGIILAIVDAVSAGLKPRRDSSP